jgi:osmotically-inducible protein OsmY
MAESPQADRVLQARSALLKSRIFALQQLDVQQTDERIMISGTVRSFYQKQLAQEMVRSVTPGLRVVNAIEVNRAG